MCGCSCQARASGGKVRCKDNIAGLHELYGPSATCLAAAATGACSKKEFAKVANLCACSCKNYGKKKKCRNGTPPPCHRRLEDYPAVTIDPSHINLGFSGRCQWDTFNDQLVHVTKVCCPQNGCSKQVPSRCSFNCGRQFSAFLDFCGGLFKTMIVGADDGHTQNPMKPYSDFMDQCRNLDPRSLATAAYTAKCAECGNSKVEPWFHEQCDDGPKNSNKPSACRPNCVKPFCGDGIKDANEQCDNGKAGSSVCTKDCKVVCLALSPPKGMTISYDRGRVGGSKAKYTCANSGKPPKKGSAVRLCQASGRWSGMPPKTCDPCLGVTCGAHGTCARGKCECKDR
jgi:hypothetical protein